jgi:hypothetical protein
MGAKLKHIQLFRRYSKYQFQVRTGVRFFFVQY